MEGRGPGRQGLPKPECKEVPRQGPGAASCFLCSLSWWSGAVLGASSGHCLKTEIDQPLGTWEEGQRDSPLPFLRVGWELKSPPEGGVIQQGLKEMCAHLTHSLSPSPYLCPPPPPSPSEQRDLGGSSVLQLFPSCYSFSLSQQPREGLEGTAAAPAPPSAGPLSSPSVWGLGWFQGLAVGLLLPLWGCP